MKNNLLRRRTSNQSSYLADSLCLEVNEEEKLLSKLIHCLKENNKASQKNKKYIADKNHYRKSNKIHMHKTVNQKSLIKSNLDSKINLSKGYTNFCGSFLFPDYEFVSASDILKDLKTKGAEKAIIKHFSKEKQKADFIKNSKPNLISRNKKKQTNSKYLNLINSVRPNYSNLNSLNELMARNNSKLHYHKNYYHFKTINADKIKKPIMSKLSWKNENKKNNNSLFKDKENITNNTTINNTINRSSFCRNSLNNSKSYSSSTSCNSKNLNYKKIFQLKYKV
jgi:hypothetical protein